MNGVKAVASVIGTVVIAGWVAFAVSAPRNVENALNEPMASLDGSSIAAKMEETQMEVRREQCATFKAAASEAWERSLDRGTTDRDAAKIDQLDRQVERFCS